MSKMMIYALKGAVGGNVENVWGHDMQVCVIDSSDQKAVDAAKANGYYNNAQTVIDVIEAKEMQKDNVVMQSQLDDDADKVRITELEEELSTALTEIAGFETERGDANAVIDAKIAEITELEQKLAVYETSKDTNGDGVISYDEMTNKELQSLLDQRKAEYGTRDSKDVLIQKAKDSE